MPYSKAENVDPEEAFVAALCSCHMLTFLYLAAMERLVVDRYDDLAVGTMTRNSAGRLSVSRVRLAPEIGFSGTVPPTDALIDRLHHAAHEQCYIANSVRTDVVVAGTWRFVPG